MSNVIIKMSNEQADILQYILSRHMNNINCYDDEDDLKRATYITCDTILDQIGGKIDLEDSFYSDGYLEASIDKVNFLYPHKLHPSDDDDIMRSLRERSYAEFHYSTNPSECFIQ